MVGATAHETGRLTLPHVAVQLPEGDRAARTVAQGIVLLMGIELADERTRATVVRGVPYARSFGAPWVGLSESTFSCGRGGLIRSKWLDRTGMLEDGRTGLWLPRTWNTTKGNTSSDGLPKDPKQGGRL